MITVMIQINLFVSDFVTLRCRDVHENIVKILPK